MLTNDYMKMVIYTSMAANVLVPGLLQLVHTIDGNLRCTFDKDCLYLVVPSSKTHSYQLLHSNLSKPLL